MRHLGHIPELPDARDEDFALFGLDNLTLPDISMDMEVYYFRLDQDGTDSCTGFSTRQQSRIWQLANLGEIVIDPSELGNYYNGRAFHAGLKDVDRGSFLRSTYKGNNAYGIVSQEHWPFDPSKVNVRPSVQAELAAYKHRKARYRKIYASGDRLHDQLRQSIHSKRPFTGGFPVYESFLPNDGPTHIELPDAAGDKPVGWHAAEFHGYKIDAQGRLWYRVGNSWGDWRENGCAWMSREYLEKAVDRWSIELVG